MAQKPLTIAIDGPAGAGKSTVAKALAKKFGYIYIDTGAMYRVVTLKALQEGIDVNDSEKLTAILEKIRITITNPRNSDESYRIFMNDQDVTEQIRDPLVSQNVSFVSRIPVVREKLVLMQQKIAAGGGVVMDGRDIGTVVLPNADFKFFLTASIDERARRRFQELQQKGYHVDYAELRAEILRRDAIDATREVSPLRMADDAILIDTTNFTIQQVVEIMANYCKGG